MAQFINPPLLPVAHESGQFAATTTGFAVDPAPLVTWELLGGVVFLTVFDFGGTSNATTMTLDLPAALVPTGTQDQQAIPIYALTDAGSDIYLGCAVLVTRVSANLIFAINGDSVTPFTNSGTKGLPVPISFSYLLSDNL